MAGNYDIAASIKLGGVEQYTILDGSFKVIRTPPASFRFRLL
jgi:hypothetical protein